MTAPATDYDILIIGGGLVGASLACALGGQPLRIGVIEAVPWHADIQPSYDDRVIALAYGSRRIFEGLGLWSALAEHVTPISKIHVSDRGHFGVTRLDARQEGVAALGYVVTARALGACLQNALATFQNIDLISPAQLTGLEMTDERAVARIQHGNRTRTLKTRLLVAADGGKSAVRELLGIHTRQRDYGQSAVIATITPGRHHEHVAYERFTDTGPLALLPLLQGHCSLVWTLPHDAVDELMALEDTAFLQQLQERFGNRLGRFQHVGKRVAYPLQLVHASEQIRPRLALIGNAAHTLHPIAGQGYNLGIRDVAALAQILVEALKEQHDIGTLETLRHYAAARTRDHRNTIGFTNALLTLFSNSLPPLALARNLGLVTLDLVPPLKHALSRHAMGLAGPQTRLARGLAL